METIKRRCATLLLIIFHCIGCAGGVTRTGTIPVPDVPLNDPALAPASRISKWWVDRHNARIKNIIINQKIILIGDSITQGYEGTEAWTALLKQYNNKITNLGFAGDGTEHVIWRLENGEFPAGINPEYIVLMIGTNNRNAPTSIAAGIGKILKIINANSPGSKILLFSILPRGSGINDTDTVRNYAVNQIIKNYSGYLGIKYIDIGNSYIKSTGELIEELFTDRLHLTQAGYAIWKDKIIEVVNNWKNY